jgi:hypothetical protein
MGENIEFILSVVTAEGVVELRKFTIEWGKNTTAVKENAGENKKNAAGQKILQDEMKQTGGQVRMLTGAIEALTGQTAKSAAASKEDADAKNLEGKSSSKAASDLEMYAKVQQQAAMQTMRSAYASEVAAANYSKFYTSLNKMEAIGTPAILKAGAWSALAIGGVAYEGIKMYAQFNKQLTQTVTQAGQSPKSLPFLSQNALDIAKQTGVSLNDVADMMYRAASGTASWNKGLGATKSQLVEVTKQIANLNVIGNIAGGTTSDQSARVLTAIGNSGLRGLGPGRSIQATRNAAYYINAIVGAGDMRQSELNSGIGRGALASAKANGMSIQDLGSWLALMTSMGTPAAVAGTYAKSGINLLTNPSTQGAKALGMLGIAPGYFQKIMSGNASYMHTENGKQYKFEGLQGVAYALSDATKKFNPFKNYPKYKGAGGAAGATALLENWGINQIPKGFVDAWVKGKLSQTQQMQATSLILTKAFGGSKQFATIAGLINDPAALSAIEYAIAKKANKKEYDKSLKIAMDTPAVKFRKDLRTVQVDLVSLGKAITPVALKLANALTGLIGIFAKFKILLVPVVALFGSLAVAAGVAKVGGILKGGYGILGSLYNQTDKVWGKLAGNDANSKRYGIFSKFMGGGQKFREVAAENMRAVEVKMGEHAIKYGQAAAMQLEASEVFTKGVTGQEVSNLEGNLGGGLGGGKGKGISKLEGSLAEEFHKGKNLQAYEKTILKNAEAKGKVITEAMVRQEMYPRYLMSSPTGRAKKDAALVKETAAKLKSMQTATGAISPLVKEGIHVAEKDVVENVAKGAAGGMITKIAGGAIGALGGPIGMIAMSMLPMALPIIGKAFGGFMSMFGGGAKTPNGSGGYTPPSSVKQIQDKIARDQAKLKPLLSAKKAGTLTTAQFNEMNRLQNEVSALNASLPGAKKYQSVIGQTSLDALLGKDGKGPGLLKAQKLANKLKATIGGYQYTHGPKGTVAHYVANNFALASDYLEIYNALPASQRAAFAAKYGHYAKGGKTIPVSALAGMQDFVNSATKNFKNTLTGKYAGSIQGKAYASYVDAQNAIKQQNQSAINDSTYIGGSYKTMNIRGHVFKVKTGGLSNLSPTDFATTRSNLEARASNASLAYRKDMALANQFGKNTDMGKALVAAANAAKAQSIKDLTELAKLSKEQHMSKESQKGLAGEIATALKLLYSDKKISAEEIGRATASALGTGGITKAVITEIANSIARN